jgi:nitrile hydratase accessory protein
MTMPDLTMLPNIALSGSEPTFDEPWQAQAFAMAINLYQSGAFEWADWADALSREIHSGVDRDYYQHWLCALEKIVALKQLVSVGELSDCKNAWQAAAERTPHGQAITL